MFRQKTITVVLPCKNEEKGIVPTIKAIPTYVDEIIVVDNGSNDNTARLAKRHGARVIKESRKQHGIGYGYAHMTGINSAKGDYIVGMDGDGTYPAEAIKEVIKYMEKNKLNMVSCNRFPLQHRAISWIRQIGVHILNWEVRILYAYPMKDILTGMWVIKRSALNHLDLKEGDWNLSPEIKLAAITSPHIRFGQFHINHHVRTGESKQNIWKTGYDHFMYIFLRRVTTDNKVTHVLRNAYQSTILGLRSMVVGFSQRIR
ncbi:glycosyltransferase family 2 protein [candidate division WWE3 bacterium]|nr:glycosyltransferase family 2 protein [candidate division WWE3 bacterium]